MTKIPENYLEKIYAGFLGMNMGIQLGAPVESPLWSYERLKKAFPDLRNPIFSYGKFAADDDVNGPAIFIRALYDDAWEKELSSQDVARAWLNYTRSERGMFWWGGYGISTEHTAYLNLKNGIEAPASGSAEVNGRILSEQIGGQIFIDTWGLVCPCDPSKAADLGETAARVSHDGEGVLGARFFCAAISEAFQCRDMEKLIDRALEELPKDSLYIRVIREVLDYYHAHPDEDFRGCRDMLADKWGYEKFGGNCPIITNAGACALAMLYGRGDLGRTIEIAVMCGWDTDCNAGNVGTVLGVMNGIEGLPERYRAPINDSIILSSAAGSLNILDAPTFAGELEMLGRKLAGEEGPFRIPGGGLCFDFRLPGSIHGFLSEGCSIKNSPGTGKNGSNALMVSLDGISPVKHCRIWYKPFYERKDFHDERYEPAFSPQVYPGERLELSLRFESWCVEKEIGVIPFVRTVWGNEIIEGTYHSVKEGGFSEICFEIPETDGDHIHEIGIKFVGNGYFSDVLGAVYLDSFRVCGRFHHRIDLAKQKWELGTITPFVLNEGGWRLKDSEIEVISLGKTQAYTGSYGTGDVRLSAAVRPLRGEYHLLAVRAQGLERGYYAGFTKQGKIGIIKDLFGMQVLAQTEFPWKEGQEYRLCVEAAGDRIALEINGEVLLETADRTFGYGMYGCVRASAGRTVYHSIEAWGNIGEEYHE